ncbi:MAG: redox-sensing transcriptional repressor Rex [Defluviitaleaceae bacterium]|nr:redox-sensing transcriptional repressor Rex [Defluviitaleaceae bacterium]
MQRIPKSTLKRLALYHRCFLDLKQAGIVKIQSRELSIQMGIESATIRKDFSYLGELGRQGYGYKIDFVLDAFEQVLNIQEKQKCILIGAGNLGRALMNFFTSERFTSELSHAPTALVAAFDNNPSISGLTINHIPILHTDQMIDYIKENQVKYVILAVPSHASQEIVDAITNLGIEGILNLTSTIINAGSMVVHEVDLAIELETLVFTAIQEQVNRKQTTIKDILDL